jgi:hypothetical protein
MPTSAAAYGGGGGGGGGGGLSPAKLIEMSDQFAEATAATADVDRDGAGEAAAARELANLVLAKEGSTLQDILVDESVRFGDAAVRRALRELLLDAPTSAVAPLGLAPPAALVELLAPSAEDERVLASAQELTDLLAPRLRSRLDAAASSAAPSADGGAPASPLPIPPQAVADAIDTLVTDAAAREDAARQLDGLQALSRRIGASLLRRAAARADGVASLPDLPFARDALVSAPRAIADAIEPSAAAPSDDA